MSSESGYASHAFGGASAARLFVVTTGLAFGTIGARNGKLLIAGHNAAVLRENSWADQVLDRIDLLLCMGQIMLL